MLFCTEEIPICTSCGHRHILGIKCDICGHVGKSQIFTKMKVPLINNLAEFIVTACIQARASDRRNFRIDSFDGTRITTEDTKFDIISELRMIAATEVMESAETEFSLVEEQSSVHLMASGNIHYFVLLFWYLIVLLQPQF